MEDSVIIEVHIHTHDAKKLIDQRLLTLPADHAHGAIDALHEALNRALHQYIAALVRRQETDP